MNSDKRDTEARPVLVVDFGAQYAQLIARRVREQHCFAEIVTAAVTPAQVRGAKAVMARA